MATKKTTKKTARKATAKTAATRKATKPTGRKPRLDPRTPAGTVLRRQFKGRDIEVKVTEAGYEFEDQTFATITAVAQRITGYGISGPVFFKLAAPAAEAAGQES